MSKKIPVLDFIAEFEVMLREHWDYEYGAARKGTVDCSGAFTYAAKKLAGLSVSHSSNQIPRKYIKELLPISEAKPGYAVFKHKKEFETDALAQKYNDGKGNFYHIGLVSRDGKHVLEAQGTKNDFIESKLSSEWKYCGALSFINYGEVKEDTMPVDNTTVAQYTHYVDVDADSWLNVREDHGTNKKAMGRLYCGNLVTVFDTYGNWSKIIYEDSPTGTGWVYTKYLAPYVYQSEPDEEPVIEVKLDYRFIITDEAGNKFYPVGGFTTDIEFIEKEE